MLSGDGGLVTAVSTDRNAPMNRITQPRTGSAQGWHPRRRGRLRAVSNDQPLEWPCPELGLAEGE